MKIITTYDELLDLFHEYTGREIHLHIERDCGTHSISFQITTLDEEIASGRINTETDDDGDFTSELAWAVLDECFDRFTTVTEYDSLIAGTNPGTVRNHAL